MSGNVNGPNRGVRIGKGKRRRIIALWAGRCWICGSKGGVLTLDHVIERRNGGGIDEENLRPACSRCNIERDRAINGNWKARHKLLRKRVKSRHCFERAGLTFNENGQPLEIA